MLGRAVTVTTSPVRIVSLVPSQTELLYDLGLREEVVGITKFCVHPEEWFRTKTRIGGTKQVHIDQVAALRPDLILANKEENVQEQIAALAAIAPVWVSDIKTLPDALQMMAAVSELCNRTAQGAALIANIKTGFDALQQQTAIQSATTAPLKVAYGIWRKPWMWAGGDTFISDLLQRVGWENALQSLPRYPSLPLESLIDYAPDMVFLSSEPYPFKALHIEEIKAVLPTAKVLLFPILNRLFYPHDNACLQATE